MTLLSIGTMALMLLGTAPQQDAKLNTPPEEFTALFNGKDLSGWTGKKEFEEHWVIKEGVIHYDAKNSSLRTEKEYGNFELHVDWKIEPKADSGIYLRGAPQVQIWDRPEGSGGLWNNVMGVAWARFYGTLHLGAISGQNMAIMVLTTAVGPLLFAASFSTTDSFTAALLLTACLPASIFFAAVFSGNPQRRAR